MSFAERLKDARKAAGISQEALAEKLGVSRQAVTKWETGRGVPDIENIIAVSDLFGIPIDEFLSREKEIAARRGYLYESRTEYDIDGKKRFDLKFGGASMLRIIGTDGEKAVIRLASNDIPTLGSDFKVKLDDVKGRIDADVKRRNGMTEAAAKESLIIDAYLPNEYLERVELKANCGELHLNGIRCASVEFSGKASRVFVDSTESAVEFDCNLDMDVRINAFSGSLAFNQVASTSRLVLPEGFSFRSVVKGIACSVYYERSGKRAEDFSDPGADNVIELNGMNSELLIVEGALETI